MVNVNSAINRYVIQYLCKKSHYVIKYRFSLYEQLMKTAVNWGHQENTRTGAVTLSPET